MSLVLAVDQLERWTNVKQLKLFLQGDISPLR
jgi:hypothetical protein